jgi:hypothetical protein
VFAVGRRVYVTASRDSPAQVTATGDIQASTLTNLVDGTEVEILGWRPHGSGGTRYRIRAMPDGVEGWLAVTNLRGTAIAVVPPPPVDPKTPSASIHTGAGRPFGQRG